jgi:hypothetical protein
LTVDFIRVIRLPRVRIRHLVIGGTPGDQQTGAQTCDSPSIFHRPFHVISPLMIDAAVGFRLARPKERTAPDTPVFQPSDPVFGARLTARAMRAAQRPVISSARHPSGPACTAC